MVLKSNDHYLHLNALWLFNLTKCILTIPYKNTEINSPVLLLEYRKLNVIKRQFYIRKCKS